MIILLLAYLVQNEVKREKCPVILSVVESLILEKQASTILKKKKKFGLELLKLFIIGGSDGCIQRGNLGGHIEGIDHLI